MSEKEVRLEEVKALEDHCDGHGVGTGNPEHTIRAFIQRRREAIEKLFAPKHEEAPAEEPAPADPEPPKEEPVQQ